MHLNIAEVDWEHIGIATLRQILHAVTWTHRHWTGRLRSAEFDFVREMIGPGDIVFDVGAHGGSWTSALSKAVPQGQVYAFEALPYYAGVLKLTARLCGWRNAHVINRAVVDDPKPVTMAWRDSSGRALTGTTHVAGYGDGSDNVVTVEGVTLDQFSAQIGSPRVTFIKLDVEGFELPVLRGADRLIKECRPVLWCELWAQYTRRYNYTPADVFQFLTERRYRTFIIDDAGKTRVPTSAETYPDQRDILAIPLESPLPSDTSTGVQ